MRFYCFLLLIVAIGPLNGETPYTDTSLVLADDTAAYLDTAVYELDKLVVTTQKINRLRMPTLQPAKIFTSEDLATTAGSAGDICRYLATLPSVVSSLSENFDNALYVRGGRPSEVIFLVDGIEMENINHFSKANSSGGPLGFINSDFIKKVDFFSGSPPVSYPARLSSVVAIDMKNGDFSEWRSAIGCKLTGGMFATEGPLSFDNSFVLAGRYIDFTAFDHYIRKWGIPKLGDLFLKGMHIVNETSDLALTGILSYNTFSRNYPMVEYDDITGGEHDNRCTNNERILQGGCGLTYRMNTGKVTHKMTLAGSFREGSSSESLEDFADTFFIARYTDNPYTEDTDERYRMMLTTSSNIVLNDVVSIMAGLRTQYQRYRMKTRYQRMYQGAYTFCFDGSALQGIIEQLPLNRTTHVTSTEAGGYMDVTAVAGDVTTSLGVRSDYFRLLRSLTLSPRCAIAWAGEKVGTLRVIGSVQHQFPTEMPSLLFYTYAYFPEMDNRKAEAKVTQVIKKLEPLRCYQTSLGFERTITPWMYLKSDIYFKWYNREYHYISPKVQEVFTFNDNHDLVLYPQNGQRKAYGFEGTLESAPENRIHFALAGSVFEVKNRYRDGNWYDDWTSVGYTASFSLGMRIFNNHRISISASGNGGRPYCQEVIIEDCIGRKTTEYAGGQEYYAKRIERLLSANIRYGFHQRINKTDVELFVEVLNIFNNQPTLEYRFNGERFMAIKPFGLLPILGGTITW